MRLNDLRAEYATNMPSSSVIYSDAVVDGLSVAGPSSSCISWNSFYSNFELASISKQLSNIVVISTTSLTRNATVVSCNNSDALSSMQGSVATGQSSMSLICDSVKWSMQTCSNKFVLCANCSGSLVSSVNVFGPCSANVSSKCIGSTIQSASSSFARLLIATFVVETAPTIVSVQTYSQKQIITAYVTVNKAGTVFCGAWTSSRVPTSVQEIMQANNVGRATTGSNKAVNISMSALTPSTQYYVYCSTMSAHGTLSTLAQAISSRMTAKTQCCKTITVNLLHRSVYAGSSLSALCAIAFTSGVSDSLTLSITSNSTSSTSLFFPQTLALTSTTAGARTVAFTGTATAGTVTLSVSVSGSASSDYSIVYSSGNTITVLSSQSKVPAPALLSAQFSNDGTAVYLTFSGATNRGSAASNAVYFTCSSMFYFRGVSSAKCQWSTDATAVTIYPSSAYPLSVGSAVFIYASKVKASCLATNATSCVAWPSNANANVTISAPGSAVKPSVLLALPSSIGSCDSLRIDIGGSSGSSGRAWSSTNFTVSSTASNVFLVAAYVTSNYKFGSPITVPRSLLQKGYLYTVSVTVCNFLGACGQASASVSVMNLAVPFAGIVGGPTFTATVNSSLQLSSTAYVASCDGSKSTLDLEYVWAVANGTSGASLSLTSKSRDPSKFILASYQLEPLVTYTFTLTVTSLSSLKSSSASVSVIVVQSDLIVVISGGSEQSVRALSIFTVDASSSYDSDQVNQGKVGISFDWECWQVSPEYSSDCMFTFAATNMSRLTSMAPSASENSTSALSLIIALSPRTANGYVTLIVLSELAPIVTITSSPSSKVIVSNKLVLQGVVSTVSDCKAVWSISDPSVDLTAVSLVPPSKVLTSASTIYLSVAPDSLPVSTSPTFSLLCTSTESGLTASASVTVLTNSPPFPGHCLLNKYSGTELATLFQLSTSGWVDSDIPISYQFGFISPVNEALLVIQSKSQLTFAQSTLPAGSTSKNYSLTTVFQIFDNLESTTDELVIVQVFAANMSQSDINLLMTNMLAQGSGNVDSLKQIVAIISSVANAVNCSGSPNCTTLNRDDCSATANTCGACLPNGYVGISGDSNEPCVSTADAFMFHSGGNNIVGQSCSTNVDCGSSWHICDPQAGACIVPNKSCPSNCSSGGGDCVYVVLGSLEVVTECLMADPQCVAQCQCNTGFYGADCSLSETALEIRQDTNYQLLDALAQVADLEFFGTTAVTSRTNSLQSLTANPYFLNDLAAQLAYNMSYVLLSAATESASVVTSSAVGILSGVVDNLLGQSVLDASRRRLSSVDGTLSTVALVDQLVSSYSSQMVPEEDAKNVIMTNYRFVTSIAPSSSTVSDFSIAIPQTDYEKSANTSVSSLTLVNATSGSSVGVTSMPLHVMGYNQSYPDFNVSSTILRVSSSSDSNGSYIFRFAHYQPEMFGVADALNANVTVTTQCIGGKAVAPFAVCPFGIVVPVQCNGTYGNYIRTVCPTKMRLPSCILSSGDLTDHATCEVMDSSASITTCRCESTLFASDSRVRNRRLASSESSLGLVEARNVVALSSYSFTAYVSVMESATRFDSLSALKASSLVCGTFALLWFGTVIIVLGLEQFRRHQRLRKSAKLAHISVAPLVERAHAVNKRHHHGDTGAMSLEESLLEYVKELFSPAFSDYSGTARLFQELWNKHQYLSVLALEYGPEQWVGAFYLLTNLTANFFMLALFYDIEFPSDDGSCSLLSSDAACVAPRSIFNTERSKCTWNSEYAICTWRQVHFDAFSTVVISVLVLLVSVPVSFVISYTCEMILLAPSVNELKEQDRQKGVNMNIRRKSAVNLMNATTEQNQRRKASTAGDIDNALKQRKRNVTVFSAVNDMEISVKRATFRAHQLSRGTIIKNKLDESSNGHNYKSFPSFVQALRDFGHHTIDTGKQTPFAVGHQRLSVNIMKKIIDEFLAFWKPLLDDEDPHAIAVHSAAHSELAAVLLSASDYVEKLKSLPPEEAGVYILELFVRDCLGRNSREATIFSQKVHPLKSKYVLTVGMKCFTFACLLLLNVYFIFTCMLYAADKGAHWQLGWLYNCIINLCVDVCINSVTMASVIYYFVPNLIVDKARHAKATVNRIIHQLCENQHLKQSLHGKMSATAYYFVSMHVARAFPDLLESRIVLGYNSFFVSRDQSLKINPFYWQRIGHRRLLRLQRSVGWQAAIARYVSLMGTWLTSFLLVFGSQSITVQQAVISLGNPGLVAVIAFIGIYVFEGSFLGIPLGAVVVIPLIIGVSLIVRYFRNRAQRDIHDLDDHKNLAMYESELYARQGAGNSKSIAPNKVAAEHSDVLVATARGESKMDIDIFSMMLSVIAESSDDDEGLQESIDDDASSSRLSTARSSTGRKDVEELSVHMRNWSPTRGSKKVDRFDLDEYKEGKDEYRYATRSSVASVPLKMPLKTDLSNPHIDDHDDGDSSDIDIDIIDRTVGNVSDTGTSVSASTHSSTDDANIRLPSLVLRSHRIPVRMDTMDGDSSGAELDVVRRLATASGDAIPVATDLVSSASRLSIGRATDYSTEYTGSTGADSEADLDQLRAVLRRPHGFRVTGVADAHDESTTALNARHRMGADDDNQEFTYERFDDDWNEIKQIYNESMTRESGSIK
jgi:hypothetical protein